MTELKENKVVMTCKEKTLQHELSRLQGAAELVYQQKKRYGVDRREMREKLT